MIKADAYGHGDVEVARALRSAGAEHLGVALIEEGLKLRSAGDRESILIFGPFDESGAGAMLAHSLTPVVNEWSQLEALAHASKKQGAKAVVFHIEINSGMNRLGFSADETPQVRQWLDAHIEFQLAGVCSHLMRGDDIADANGESAKQQAVFSRSLAAFHGLQFQVHLLNSGACVKLRSNLSRIGPVGARPGIAIYGAQTANEKKDSGGIHPVLTLKTRLCHVHRIKAGEGVSYGPKWRATRASVIGVVPMGYADGYSRALSGNGIVLFRGRRAKIVGTICMDYFMIDLTDISSSTSGTVEVGEEIVLIGKQGEEEISAVELAALANTISYEILSGLGSRVPRVYV
jgi:alanine racemase